MTHEVTGVADSSSSLTSSANTLSLFLAAVGGWRGKKEKGWKEERFILVWSSVDTPILFPGVGRRMRGGAAAMLCGISKQSGMDNNVSGTA